MSKSSGKCVYQPYQNLLLAALEQIDAKKLVSKLSDKVRFWKMDTNQPYFLLRAESTRTRFEQIDAKYQSVAGRNRMIKYVLEQFDTNPLPKCVAGRIKLYSVRTNRSSSGPKTLSKSPIST